MKGFFRKLLTRIVPELKYLFLRAIPAALVLMWLFVKLPIFGNNSSVSKAVSSIYWYGFLLSLLGVYIARLVAWIIWRIFTSRYDLIPDIYESKER
jgi:uncharacterized membrane protein